MAVTLSIIVTDNANGTLTFTPTYGGSATQTGGTAIATPSAANGLVQGSSSLSTDDLKNGVVSQGLYYAGMWVKDYIANAYETTNLTKYDTTVSGGSTVLEN